MQPKVLFLTLYFAFVSFSLCAQEENPSEETYPSFKFGGILKNKFEYVNQTERDRFSVRNSRLGVTGKIAPLVDYRAQVELSSEGKFQVLDLSGTLRPYKGLSFTFGQTGIPIFNSYTTNPGTMLFANRTFLAKYYAGTRDIGLLTKYSFDAGNIPISIEGGLYNGSTINNPVWTDKLSYAARLSFGKMKGFRSTIKMYDYPNSPEKHYFLYGIDFRYEGDNWKVETEAMKRDDKINKENSLFASYVQGAYSFPIKGKMFKNVIPALRWDAIDQKSSDKGIDINRITAGLGFGLSSKPFTSLLRLDYEWYFVKNKLDSLFTNEEMDSNKLTVELVFIF